MSESKKGPPPYPGSKGRGWEGEEYERIRICPTRQPINSCHACGRSDYSGGALSDKPNDPIEDNGLKLFDLIVQHNANQSSSTTLCGECLNDLAGKIAALARAGKGGGE